MSLQELGETMVVDGLSGNVGLLAGEVETDGFQRRYARLKPGVTTELTFGPAREPTQVTGVAIFRDGKRLLSRTLAEPRQLGTGQWLRVRLNATASID